VNDLAIAVLGVLGAITGLARTVAEALGSRVRARGTPEGATFLQGISTEDVDVSSLLRRKKELRINVACVALGLAIMWYGTTVIADDTDLDLARWAELFLGIVVFLEGLALLISSASAVQELLGADDERLHETAAQVTLNVSIARGFELATNAMLGIGAVRSTGTSVLAPDEKGRALLRGGTGVWPSHLRGCRVTIELVALPAAHVRRAWGRSNPMKVQQPKRWLCPCEARPSDRRCSMLIATVATSRTS
jgi:hypothetical protein